MSSSSPLSALRLRISDKDKRHLDSHTGQARGNYLITALGNNVFVGVKNILGVGRHATAPRKPRRGSPWYRTKTELSTLDMRTISRIAGDDLLRRVRSVVTSATRSSTTLVSRTWHEVTGELPASKGARVVRRRDARKRISPTGRHLAAHPILFRALRNISLCIGALVAAPPPLSSYRTQRWPCDGMAEWQNRPPNPLEFYRSYERAASPSTARRTAARHRSSGGVRDNSGDGVLAGRSFPCSSLIICVRSV
jgi:hypothetical protein